MKWYLAINEEGVSTDIGDLAKLAVLSARKNTTLRPHLLYRGKRNRFTAWMEDRGVTVIDTVPQYEPVMRRAIEAGWYPGQMTGHWMRTEICDIEMRDEYVLYTDADVLFLRDVALDQQRPKFLAGGPETDMNARDHFNAGVMLMNVPAMRGDYPRLRAAIQERFLDGERVPFHGQDILNRLYAGLWDRLDPIYNWKPYWPLNAEAVILHFHGPKLDTIRAMFDGTWNWDDESGYGLLAGELIASQLSNYLAYLELMRDLSEPGDSARTRLEGLLRDAPAAVPRVRAEWARWSPQAASLAEAVVAQPVAPNVAQPVAEVTPPLSDEAAREWRPEGAQAWVRQDRRALVFRDGGVWRAALRHASAGYPNPSDPSTGHPASGHPEPAFLTDAQRRIRAFPTAADARLACDAEMSRGA